MFNGSYDSSQKKLLTFRNPYFSKGKHLTKKTMKTFYAIFTAEIIFLPLANKHQKLNWQLCCRICKCQSGHDLKVKQKTPKAGRVFLFL